MHDGESTRPELARREVLAVAGVVAVLLVALSGRYGYHRDELYFLEAGRHLAWGYPDQPPLVPLLARLMDAVAPGSLVVLRLPSALAAAGVVVLAALTARELGARRSGQVVAAVVTGLDGVVLATGHLLSTTTFAFLGWAALTLLLVRILRGVGGRGTWVVVGVVAGLTVEANPLLVSLLVVLAVSCVAVGPRDLLRTSGPYLAAAIAAVLAAPYVIWQLAHGLPQLDVARAIADGGSGTSSARVAVLPMQLLIIGPWLVPIWLTGLVRLVRDRRLRVLGVGYLAFAVVVIASGGKAYYLGGLYPLLLAAGAQPVVDRIRARGAAVLLVLSVPAIGLILPVLPVRAAGIAVAVNADTGETIGWPSYVDQIAAAYRTLPAGTAILTDNYGQAGAVDRYGPSLELPPAYSGHNGFAAWGPPPSSPTSVLAVGLDDATLADAFTSCTEVATLTDPYGIDNDEDGTVLDACIGPRRPWAELWPELSHDD